MCILLLPSVSQDTVLFSFIPQFSLITTSVSTHAYSVLVCDTSVSYNLTSMCVQNRKIFKLKKKVFVCACSIYERNTALESKIRCATKQKPNKKKDRKFKTNRVSGKRSLAADGAAFSGATVACACVCDYCAAPCGCCGCCDASSSACSPASVMASAAAFALPAVCAWVAHSLAMAVMLLLALTLFVSSTMW